MSKETHIVSLVIHALAKDIEIIILKAEKLPQAECHHEKQHNKFVLVFEAKKEADISSIMDDITHWQGVMSVQLCYHHCESETSLLEEIDHAIHAS
ncbi:MAG: chaperone NapD [Gammaproteobacteria bacterium]|jgi:nitrate reductase NapAB chaperone NapD|nr:hypothetical protein [Gammaproteobacteria bacterium]